MATNLETLGTQMSDVENQLSQYDANLPSEIETQIKNAYTPALQQSLGVTKNLMSDYLGKYFDITSMGPGTTGTTAKDLSPVQKLSVMGNQLGTMAGQLTAQQQYTDYLGGQATDMYEKAITAAQYGQTALADKYARLSTQYQTAWQEAENEKDRALQLQLAALSGSGGTTINYNTGDTSTDTGTDTTSEGSSNDQDPDISVDDSWFDKLLDNTTIDPTDTSQSKVKRLSAAISMNPFQQARNIGTYVGNLAGNWQNDDMSFWDKLLNNRQ